jgi:hypothetical protein
MGIRSDTCHRAIASIAVMISILCSAAVAGAGTSLYTGSIQIRLDSGPVYDYSIPFGANFSYPRMNNLPTGDLATTLGGAPLGIGIAPNQLTLKTSLSTFSPPWYHTWVRTEFSGGNGSGTFSAGGAPGPATSAPVTTASGSHFGVSFSGTPTQFGGTMRVLADFSARYGIASAANLPLGAIGGSFGGKLTGTGHQGGTGSPGTFFTESVWGFPWTTGTVMATVPSTLSSGGSSTVVRRTAMGSDLRTPQGIGNLQLVTPFVVRKRANISGALLGTRAGIAILSLQFVPEPSAIAQLAAGLSALAALYGFSLRKTGSSAVQREPERKDSKEAFRSS